METLSHIFIFISTSGIGLALIWIGGFIKEQRVMNRNLASLNEQFKIMNGSVKDVVATVSVLPCEVEKRNSVCPGGGG